jgi:hypothetical protein
MFIITVLIIGDNGECREWRRYRHPWRWGMVGGLLGWCRSVQLLLGCVTEKLLQAL